MILIITSPFIRCVETACEIYDVLTETEGVEATLVNIYVDKGLCEFLKKDWFFDELQKAGSSKMEDLFLTAHELQQMMHVRNGKQYSLTEHTILPSDYQLEL